MKSIRTFIGLIGMTSLLFAGCSVPSASDNGPSPSAQTETKATAGVAVATENKGDHKLKIVTTFYPMYDFTKNVAGDLADVSVLIPTGVEPHDWEPTAKDIQQLADADLFVYNGLVEGWVSDTIKSVNSKTLQVVEASKGMNLMEGIPEEEEGEHADGEHDHAHESNLDPHVWLDPVLAQQEVKAIEETLMKADPAHADTYKKNAAAYLEKLQALDKSYRDTISTTKRKDFMTQHAAFGYLARQYGLTQIPISGLSPDVEPSPAKLVEIVKFAKEQKVKTIFFEELISPKIAETVAKEIGAKSNVLSPIEGLADEDKANGLDYIGVMEKNLKALEAALNE
ncbi:zinc ABC transporter substrate-binding protein [Brevibacillus fluminis]|uniref:Zinc ABC transporter substrate-binding protein n=1 Tax=Brevibacillus fluminis TaxID=511487 RepID=A0A3M8DUJ3_9BACL|nr:metal ABC transporter substrate-binding protein [Brevibacillus fluminis]RNB91762.1 zinc ABC transporter substrate-binding protein [Brevibacillus fluminis]